MARRRSAEKRKIIPDPKFHSTLVTRFVNSLMKRGKKRPVESMFYKAVDILSEKSKQDGLNIFQKALDNVMPVVEVKSRRIGGANYQVPVEVASNRRVSLAIRWIITYARARSERNMAEKLAGELFQASRNEGGAIRKKIDTHKMAEANRAFAHFRW